jgi:putative ABC transport system substrate-binding protein
MRRREFIAGIGSAAVLPLVARGQQRPVPVIGYFDWTGPIRKGGPDVAALRQGLAAAGYVEGKNVAIEYRWADGQYSRLPALAADLVGRQVDVILATGILETARAARAATATIPIVVAAGGDPVTSGLATSLSRPGGNVTGMTWISDALTGKRLDLLHQMVPQATTVAFLSNESRSPQQSGIIAAARVIGLQVIVVEARSERDIEAAFATIVQRDAGALIVDVVPHFTYNSTKIAALAAYHKIPAIYPFSVYTSDGGLMSYGASMVDNLRQVGVDYVARILKGANPADLPIQQPTKFPLIINLKTAKALGLTVPPTLLALADEVIE